MGVSACSSRSEAFSQLVGLDFDVMQRAPRGLAGLIHRAVTKEAFVFHFLPFLGLCRSTHIKRLM